MFEVILLIAGVVAGFCLYKKLIMSDSRQNTINNKILSAVTSEQLNKDSSALAVSIREEINNSYRLEWQDIKSCVTDYFCSTGTCNEATSATAESKEEYKDDEIEVLLKSKFDCLKDWDIRSLSKRESVVTEEPLVENETSEEASFSPENKPKEVEAEKAVDEKAPSSPKKTKTKAESKPKKNEPAAEDKPKKENTPHGGNSKK